MNNIFYLTLYDYYAGMFDQIIPSIKYILSDLYLSYNLIMIM